MLLGLVAAGCGSAPEPQYDPAIEAEFLERRRAIEEEKGRQSFEGDLIKIDQAIDKYASAWLTTELSSSDRLREKLEQYLRGMVDRHLPRLLATADRRDLPAQRAISLAALGFSGRQEALDTLLNGARDDDPLIATAALFGLAVLHEPNTPPGVLGEIMTDAKKPVDVRRNASLALVKLQEHTFKPEAIEPYWEAVLAKPLDSEDSGIQVHALRGLGLRRNPAYAHYAEKFASHPHAMVRSAAAIAMGRMKNTSSVPTLLGLLGPAETNDNVRLAARKALQELAGGIDRYYDVAAWRKVFERGGD